MDTQQKFLNEGTKEHIDTNKTIDNVSPPQLARVLVNEKQNKECERVEN